MAERPLLPQGAHEDKGTYEKRRPKGVPPTFLKTVVVPITASMDFRGSGDKKKQPSHSGPPPLPNTPRPRVETPPGRRSEDDRRRPQSPPASPRNEGFRYPGSELPGRRPSLRATMGAGAGGRRYGDDLPVFNNGIGGGPIQRYPIMEDGYNPPSFPGQPFPPGQQPTTSSSSSPNSSRALYSADAQPPPRRPGRPEQYSYTKRNL